MRRGIARLFVVLTPLWMAYCLVVYPMQQRSQAQKVEKAKFLDCYAKSADFKGCADWARADAGTDMWTLRAFYARESWLLALALIGVPLLAYAACRVVVWVGRGFIPVTG